MRTAIDGLTVLVLFLLISAAHLSVMAVQPSIAVREKQRAPMVEASASEPDIRVSLGLLQSGDTELKVTGLETREETIHALPNGRNLKETVAILRELKQHWPRLEKVTLVAERNVAYQDVVRTLEAGKAVVPTMQLGGL